MQHENSDPKQPESPFLQQELGEIATVDAFINDVLGKEPSKTEVTEPLTSKPVIMSREEYARQQDIQARLNGEHNPYFD